VLALLQALWQAQKRAIIPRDMPKPRKRPLDPVTEAQIALQHKAKVRERRRTSSDWSVEEYAHKMARREARRTAEARGNLPPKEKRRCGFIGYQGPDRPCKQGRYIVFVPLKSGSTKPMMAPTCYAHLTPDQKERYAKVQGQDDVKAVGRPRQPRVVDALREQVEAHVAEIIGPLFEALEADKPIVVGNGPHATVELHPDHRTRIQAIQEILDRVYGKSKQTTEHTGQVGFTPVEVPVDSQREQEVAAILAQSGALGTILQSTNPARNN